MTVARDRCCPTTTTTTTPAEPCANCTNGTTPSVLVVELDGFPAPYDFLNTSFELDQEIGSACEWEFHSGLISTIHVNANGYSAVTVDLNAESPDYPNYTSMTGVYGNVAWTRPTDCLAFFDGQTFSLHYAFSTNWNGEYWDKLVGGTATMTIHVLD